jgi:putative membrane protein
MSNTATATVNETQFRNGVMPRAQLSKAACEIALQKTKNADILQFAEWELMEATTVIRVLKDLNTPAPAINPDAKAFLAKLESMSEAEFNAEYMQAELSNHEFLRDLAQEYIDGFEDRAPMGQQDTWHVASLALFAFTEHVGLCKKLKSQLQ